ncbi:hypothetical protein D3C77_351660 [compost metagenome]
MSSFWIKFQHKIPKMAGIITGAILAAIGLELFLMPHGIVVGGMTGISALMSFYTEMRLGLFLFMLNLPFIVLQYRYIRASFNLMTILAILVLSMGTILLHPFPALFDSPIAAAMSGGVSLGLGIGLVIRFGGHLDTAEKAVAWINYKLPLPAEWLMLILNCGILIVAGMHLGLEQALYSIIAYFLAFESVKLPLRHFRIARTLCIVSRKSTEIEEILLQRLNLTCTQLSSRHGIDGEIATFICTVRHWEELRLRAIVQEIDKEADIALYEYTSNSN